MENTTIYISQDLKRLQWSYALQLVNAVVIILASYKLSEEYGTWILAAAVIFLVCCVVAYTRLARRDRLRVTFTDDAIRYQVNFEDEPSEVCWSDVQNVTIGVKNVELTASDHRSVEIPLEAMYEITAEIKNQFRARAKEKGVSVVG